MSYPHPPFHRLLPRLLAMTLTLTGCSTQITRDVQTDEALQEAFEIKPGAAPAAPPEEVSQALLPPVQLQLQGVGQTAPAELRFDVKVRQVRARDFFLSLVEDTPYSMVIDPQISGYISLDMKNVTVPEVMEVVRSVHGYDYKQTGRIYQVFPNTIHTRIFKIDYLAVKRAGESLTTAKSGQITTAGSTNGENTNSANSSAITTTNNADFWAELKQSLAALLESSEGRRISINAQTGVLMVRAMPDELRVIEEYLNTSQRILQRQVVLEARILEVTLNDAFQSGINWASLQEDSVTALTGGGTIFDGSGYSSLKGSQNLLSNSADYGNGFNALNSAAGGFGGVFGFALATPDFSAFIELLKTQGDVQVLSSPHVSTVNNQKAVIKVGNDEFFVTGIDSDTTVSGLADNTNISVDLEPFFSGVALDVTPQISEQGDIVLHIHPAVSEVTEQTKTVTTTDGTLTLPLAASSIRESDTVIRAANGQVVVIGGLMQNITEDQEASIPLLGDIPLLGYLFKHTKKRVRKSELVILLKPVVVDNNGNVWRHQLERASGTIRDMSRGM